MKEERQKRTTRLAIWTSSWVCCMAIATFGPKFLWMGAHWPTVIAIGITFVVGLAMIAANRNLFNHFDELERKLHLEALAFTSGLTVVTGLCYSLLDQTNLIPWDAEIGVLIIFMGIVNLISLHINTKRYA